MEKDMFYNNLKNHKKEDPGIPFLSKNFLPKFLGSSLYISLILIFKFSAPKIFNYNEKK